MGLLYRKAKPSEPKVEELGLKGLDVNIDEIEAAEKVLMGLYQEIDRKTSSRVLGGTLRKTISRVLLRFEKDKISPEGRLYIAGILFKNLGSGSCKSCDFLPPTSTAEQRKADIIIKEIEGMLNFPIISWLLGHSARDRVRALEADVQTLSAETVAAMMDGFFERIKLSTR